MAVAPSDPSFGFTLTARAPPGAHTPSAADIAKGRATAAPSNPQTSGTDTSDGSGPQSTDPGSGGTTPADAPVPQPTQPGQYVFWQRECKLTITTGKETKGAQPMPGEQTSDATTPPAGGLTRKALRDLDTGGGSADTATTTLPEVTVTAKRDPVEGKLLDLSDYHLVFEVEQSAYSTPWKLTARVYNLEQAVMEKITKEYTEVKLEAGYKYGPKGVIFNGVVSYFERGKDSPTDTVLIIHASEYDLVWNQTPVNATLAAGSTSTDVVKACVAEMGKNGDVKLGDMSQLSTGRSPRARTVYGPVSDVLRDVAQSEGATIFINDGKLHVFKIEDALKLPAIRLNSTTAMIGIPYQTLDGGVNVRSLLNPDLVPCRKVHIDEKDIRQIAVKNAGLTKAEMGSVGFFDAHNQIKADGIYKIYSLRHSGDNRGNDWYTDIVTDKVQPSQMAPTVG